MACVGALRTCGAPAPLTLSVRPSQESSSMNRTLFLTLYISGILSVWLSGNPWSRVNFVIANPANPQAALTVGFFISLLVPLALTLVAALRGRSIGKPRLFFLPLLAILFSALAFLYGWLSRALNDGEPSASGFLPISVAIGIGMLAGVAPLILHVVCCVLGASKPKAEATTRPLRTLG